MIEYEEFKKLNKEEELGKHYKYRSYKNVCLSLKFV